MRASRPILFLSFQPVGQPVGGDPEGRKQMPPPPPCPGREGSRGTEPGVQEAGLGSLEASLPSAGRELFDDPSYVNVQNLDKARQAGAVAGHPNPAVNGSAPRDLFDMSECSSPFRVCLRPRFLLSSGLFALSFLAYPPWRFWVLGTCCTIGLS